jgi:dinuclear metal center YbgI/SA1388 family protein
VPAPSAPPALTTAPTSGPTLGEVAAILHGWYDPATAEDWDAVGLVAGDPAAPVRRVLFAVDPVQAVVDEAVEWGADLLVVHHPLLLRPVSSVAATTPKGRAVHTLVRNGVALLAAHTNADVPAGGVSAALADAVGVHDARPLQAVPAAALDKLVVFVPHADAERLVDALADAGAGAVGDYDRCVFTSTGLGSFRPGPGATPAIGEVGRVEQVPETRVEMVVPRPRRDAVLGAMRAAHPYEEPAFDLLEMADLPGDSGHGRIGRLAEGVPLREFVDRVVAALPANASGARVAGDLDATVRTVAVCGGSGDFLLDRVRQLGADVYLTSDLRHHPVSELLEQPDAPAVVDVPHWAAEATWLPVVEQRLRTELAARGTTVETRQSTIVTDPWTSLVPMTPRSLP